MSQDNKKSFVMYQGDGSNNVFSVPMTKGKYGTISVAFVRRGLDQYEYNPDTWGLNGGLFSWDLSGTKVYTDTAIPTIGATIYDQYGVDTGDTVTAVGGATITVNTNVYTRDTLHDVDENSVLTWTGTTLEVGDYIVIERTTTRTQPFEFPNNQKHIEKSDDNLERQIQEVADKVDNALLVDPTHTIDSNKMNPVEWMQTILRSVDKSVRGFRFLNGWLDYSLDDPNIADADKTWAHLLNTDNIKSVRERKEIEDGEEHCWVEYLDQNGQWKVLVDSNWDAKIEEIKRIADEAEQIADEAKDIAEEAKETAVSTANDAKAIAQNAATDAENAVQTATNATDIANAANATAESAKTTATNASIKADAAVSTANSALQKANTAMVQSSDALADAAVSLENSEQAVATANVAKNTADGIDGKATSALTNSEQAVATANVAKNTADNVAVAVTGKADVTTTDTLRNDVDGLGDQVHEIEAKVPAAATADNQLADKAFVNSSINAIAAYYITSTPEGDSFATKADLDNGPYYFQGAVRVPTTNDYALVKADETHEGSAARYMYDGKQWDYQYTLNDTSFTQAQVDAINSGITAGLVSKYNATSDTVDMLDSEVGTLNTEMTTAQSDIGALKTASNTQAGLISDLQNDKADKTALPQNQTGTAGQVYTKTGDGAEWQDAGGGSGSGRNIGDIFYTTRTDTALAGAVECNGGTYSTADYTGDGSIGELLEAGKLDYISLTDYATAISTKGWCDKIGWNGTGTTSFRVPTLTPRIIQTNNIPVVGNGFGLGLTNGVWTGNPIALASTSYTPFSKDGINEKTLPTNNTKNLQNGTSGGNVIGVSTDPSQSGIIADLSETANLRVMVQLATGATDQALETCTGVLSDVSGLKDMSNVTATGKETVVGWGMPDYSAVVSMTSGSVAPKNGWAVAHGNNASVVYSVNNVQVAQGDWIRNVWSGNWNLQIMVSAGDVVTGGSWKFIPCKGVN